MIVSHYRGYPIQYINKTWVYSDTKTPIEAESRPCVRCGKIPRIERYDACLGYIEGLKAACCGHGIDRPYFKKLDGEE